MIRVNRKMRARRQERNHKILISVLAAFTLLFICFGIYVNDFYRADTEAIAQFLPELEIEERKLEGGAVAYIPDECKAGVIFYPGGKVEHTAYIPLMKALAENGILAVLVEMPYNLAVLKKSAADGIKEQLFFVDKWYMAGHSLGGSMAADYALSNKDDFEGVILLAAYSTKNLKDSGLKVASIYGDKDGVLDIEKYYKYKKNLPSDLEETVMEGANHSGFGMYGLQDTDGAADITNTRQIKQTADIIAEFAGVKISE